jgi:hypothetical protein
MAEDYQLPPEKPIDEQLMDLIKAILEQLPKERRYFQEAVEAALLCRLPEQQRALVTHIAASLVPGFKAPSRHQPREENTEESEAPAERGRKTRRTAQIFDFTKKRAERAKQT